MKIAIVDTYYASFLASHYANNKRLKAESFSAQRNNLLGQCFGTSDFYSRHLTSLGHSTEDFIVNCLPIQEAWAREHQVSFSSLALRVPHRFFRLPVIGSRLSSLPGLLDIAVAQVRDFAPDVLYCQDLSFFPPEVLNELRNHVHLIVGQIACPMPPLNFLKSYDLILTSFPHFVSRLQSLGISSEYFRIGFDTRVLDLIGSVSKNIDVSFVGGISRHHGNAVPLLEFLANHTPIEFFGYGVNSLPRSSPIHSRHNGEVWGLDMYRALARSKITINRHINVAENNANNMRLFEATGIGSLLITDRKDNLCDLFEIGKEVLAYSSQEEAVDLIRFYLDHPDQAALIARAGQTRTLSEHTYQHRMLELVQILQRHLRLVR